jgi:hypothetical protein
MNSKQMDELDDWLAENVFGFVVKKGGMEYDGEKIPWKVWQGIDSINRNPKRFTSDSADAMLVLKECMSAFGPIACCGNKQLGFSMWDIQRPCEGRVDAETFELSICLLAKKLFENHLRSKGQI